MLCMLFLPGPGPAGGDGALPGWNKLVSLIYRIKMTNYCGFTTEQAAAAFRSQRDLLLGEYSLAKPLVENARAESAALAPREGANRGLGGVMRSSPKDPPRYAQQLASDPRSLPTAGCWL